MINTSAAYKEAIKKNRILHHEAKIEFSDGTALTPQDQDLYTFKISENTSNEKSFDLGSAIAKQLKEESTGLFVTTKSLFSNDAISGDIVIPHTLQASLTMFPRVAG